MIRVNDTEFNAHGYISTDGVMDISFETDKDTEEIKELFEAAGSAEMFDRYLIKAVRSVERSGDEVRVQADVGVLSEEPKEEAKETLTVLETVDDYVKAVDQGVLTLLDVPADTRDDVAIKLGV